MKSSITQNPARSEGVETKWLIPFALKSLDGSFSNICRVSWSNPPCLLPRQLLPFWVTLISKVDNNH